MAVVSPVPLRFKTCRVCDEAKPARPEFFNKHGQTADRLDNRCRHCKRRRHQEMHADRPWVKSYRNFTATLGKYGLTVDDYCAMWESQGGVCAICGKWNQYRERLVVDHCHETGKVRGLLCDACNCGIGYLQEDPEVFLSAVRYLSHD